MIFMKKHFPLTTFRRCAAAAALTALLPMLGMAATGTDNGSDIALAATAVMTAVIIALLFYVLIVLDGDLSSILAVLTRVKNYILPPESENGMEMDEDFDGIRELDNRVPPWFNYLFYGSIVFALVYMVNFHILNSSKLPLGEYQDELTAAGLERQILIATQGSIDESTLTVLKDPAAVKAGMENFAKYCVSCHGTQAGGIVGPNLTDKYWINGGGVKNVYRTIKMGVPAKGMISWELVFTPKQIQELASYVLSLQGTSPVVAKAPQGTIWVDTDTTAVRASVDSLNVKSNM